MPIKFQCSSCGKTIRVSEKSAGKRGKCPGCQQVVTVPPAPAAQSPPTAVEVPAKKKPEPADAKSPVKAMSHPVVPTPASAKRGSSPTGAKAIVDNAIPREYRKAGCLPAVLAVVCAIACFLLGWMLTFGPKETHLFIGLGISIVGLFVSLYFLVYPPIGLRFSDDGFKVGKQDVVHWSDISSYEIFVVGAQAELLGIKFKENAKSKYDLGHAAEAPDLVKVKFDYTMSLMDFRCPSEHFGEFLLVSVEGKSSTVMTQEEAKHKHAKISGDQLGKKLARLGPGRRRYLLELPGIAITPLCVLAVVGMFLFLSKGDLRRIAPVASLLGGFGVFGLFFWWHRYVILPPRTLDVFENGFHGESKNMSVTGSWDQIASLTIAKQRIDQFGLIPTFKTYEIALQDGTTFKYAELLNGKVENVEKLILEKAKLQPVKSDLVQGKFYQKLPS